VTTAVGSAAAAAGLAGNLLQLPAKQAARPWNDFGKIVPS